MTTAPEQSVLLIGIDLGTSAVKCTVHDAAGTLRGTGRIAYPLETADGAALQDANVWWQATLAALTTALQGSDVTQVIAIGVGGQAPSPVALSPTLEPLGKVAIWLDRRPGAYAAALQERLGARQQLIERLGIRMAAHAAWARDARPEQFAAARWYLHSWDYLVARLTGTVNASMAPWSPAIEAMGLPAELFGDAEAAVGSIAGTVSASVAARTGVPVGTPVVAAGVDSFSDVRGQRRLALRRCLRVRRHLGQYLHRRRSR